jgi:Polyketide cyclase / dehydrase and lipid transport
VDGWTWVEGTINAPPQAVFEWFADDSDKLPFIVPQVSVVGPVEKERLANGGLRMRARLKFLWRTREVVGEDTAYEPYTLLRGWTRSGASVVEVEKRFTPVPGGTHMVWGTRLAKGGFSSKLNRLLAPAYTRLWTRISLLQSMARSRAALEVAPQAQAVTEPSWIAARMPAPTPVPFAWLRLGALLIGIVIALVIDTVVEIVWPPLMVGQPLHVASYVVYLALVVLCVQLLSLVGLRLVPARLPDAKR